jgi:hypothetical protein
MPQIGKNTEHLAEKGGEKASRLEAGSNPTTTSHARNPAIQK